MPFDLVHMPSRLDGLLLLPELDGPLRVILQVHLGRIPLQAGKGEHLVHHLEDQHILPGREVFGDAEPGRAVIADLFDVQPFPHCCRSTFS
jgi:hypothetical protein